MVKLVHCRAAVKMLLEDESRFVDFSASRPFLTTAHPMFGS